MCGATSTWAAGIGVLIESTARLTSLPATTSSRSLSATLDAVGRPRPIYVDVDHIPAGGPRGEEGGLLADENTLRKPEHIRARSLKVSSGSVPAGLPSGPAVPRHRSDVRDLVTHADRHDRREHPRPPLRALRGRRGTVSNAGSVPSSDAGPAPAAEPAPAAGVRTSPPQISGEGPPG